MPTMQGRSDNEQKVKDFLRAIFDRMPKSDHARLQELSELYSASQDEDEKEEILGVFAEILSPYLSPIAPVPGQVVDMEEGVSEKAKQGVDKYRKYVGSRIREQRKIAGLTQEQLADKVGMPQSHICRLENGVHTATDYTIERIAKALGINPSVIDFGCDP